MKMNLPIYRCRDMNVAPMAVASDLPTMTSQGSSQSTRHAPTPGTRPQRDRTRETLSVAGALITLINLAG